MGCNAVADVSFALRVVVHVRQSRTGVGPWEVTVGSERGLQPADRLLAPAVTQALGAIELEAEDVAAQKLAERYAREIDQADAAAAHADKVLRAFSADADPDLFELVKALKAKLSARVAVSDLGPKLLAALDSLGATPKARAQRKGGAAGGKTNSKLAALRANRAG